MSLYHRRFWLVIFFSISLFLINIFTLNDTLSYNSRSLRYNRRDRMKILVICHNRPVELNNMLHSLLNDVRGVNKDDILISQSGNNTEVYDVAKAHDLVVIQHIDTKSKKLEKLGLHFKWSFERFFEMYPKSEGVIVLEDDLIFSPDFLEYFELTVPLLKKDKTLFSVSAWNDNGYKEYVCDSHRLKRSTFFPGLGWYLQREQWEYNLKYMWKKTDWDWVVRKYIKMNNMEVIVPEISRDYHASSSGTYMNKNLFIRLFKNIELHRDIEFRWMKTDIEHVTSPVTYERHMSNMMKDSAYKKIFNTNEIMKFKLWNHEKERSSWRGIREICYQSERIFLVDDIEIYNNLTN